MNPNIKHTNFSLSISLSLSLSLSHTHTSSFEGLPLDWRFSVLLATDLAWRRLQRGMLLGFLFQHGYELLGHILFSDLRVMRDQMVLFPMESLSSPYTDYL